MEYNSRMKELSISHNQLVLLGICSDENSSHLKGAASAPPLIRKALYSGSSNLTAENGVSLAANSRLVDIGDFDIADGEVAFMSIEEIITTVLNQGGLPLTLGGDHAITYPVMRAIAKQHSSITLLHFDAHPDLYDHLDGNRLSHASPFARIMPCRLKRCQL